MRACAGNKHDEETEEKAGLLAGDTGIDVEDDGGAASAAAASAAAGGSGPKRRKGPGAEGDGKVDVSSSPSSSSSAAAAAAKRKGPRKNGKNAQGHYACYINYYIANLLLVSLAFLCVFTPFNAIQNLESSLPATAKMGPRALAMLYVITTVSCLGSPAVVAALGSKYTMVISSIFICIFVVAHIKPTWFTLFPASGSVGLWLAFMWTAQGVYVTRNAISYARHVKAPPTTYLGFFNGVFLSVYGLTQIGGNLISSAILEKGPTPQTLSFLFGMFLGMALLATILFVLLRRDESVMEGDEPVDTGSNITGWDQTKSMLRLLVTPSMVLMMPLACFQGLVFGFIVGDFTRDVVMATLGVTKIGMTMSIFGGASIVGALVMGKLCDVVGRVPCFLVAIICGLASLVFLMQWSM